VREEKPFNRMKRIYRMKRIGKRVEINGNFFILYNGLSSLYTLSQKEALLLDRMFQ
jgi:hypothetical protein